MEWWQSQSSHEAHTAFEAAVKLIAAGRANVSQAAARKRGVANDQGDGDLNAAEADCTGNPGESLYCMLAFTINALADQKQEDCRRNDSRNMCSSVTRHVPQSCWDAHASTSALVPECRMHYLASALGSRSYEQVCEKRDSNKPGR